jgi:hypothetical protein
MYTQQMEKKVTSQYLNDATEMNALLQKYKLSECFVKYTQNYRQTESI